MARRLSIGRLRGGELLAGAGAVVLLVALWLPWFGLDVAAWAEWVRAHAHRLSGWTVYLTGGPYHWDGWTMLGWLVLAIAAAAIALTGWLLVATAAARPVTHVVAASVLTAVTDTLAFVVLALRALVFQPGPNVVYDLRYGAWIGLAGALAMTIGAWWSLADERIDAPESAYVPPAPRPAPPPASS